MKLFEPNNHEKGRLYTLIAFIVLVLAGAAYTLNHLYTQEQQEEATYRTENARTGDIVIKTVAAGSIQPRQEILIKPQISGIVRRVQVEAVSRCNQVMCSPR